MRCIIVVFYIYFIFTYFQDCIIILFVSCVCLTIKAHMYTISYMFGPFMGHYQSNIAIKMKTV